MGNIHTIDAPTPPSVRISTGERAAAAFVPAIRGGEKIAAFAEEQLAETIALDRERTIADSESDLALSIAQYKLDMDKNPDPDAALLEFTQRAGAEAERIAAGIGETDAELAQAFAADAIGIVTVGSIDASVYNEGRKKSIRLAKLDADELPMRQAIVDSVTDQSAMGLYRAYEARIRASLDLSAQEKEARILNFGQGTDLDRINQEILNNPESVHLRVYDRELFPYLTDAQRSAAVRSARGEVRSKRTDKIWARQEEERKASAEYRRDLSRYYALLEEGNREAAIRLLKPRSEILGDKRLTSPGEATRIAALTENAKNGVDLQIVDNQLYQDLYARMDPTHPEAFQSLNAARTELNLRLGKGIWKTEFDALETRFKQIRSSKYRDFEFARKAFLDEARAAIAPATSRTYFGDIIGFTEETAANWRLLEGRINRAWTAAIEAGTDPEELLKEGGSLRILMNQLRPSRDEVYGPGMVNTGIGEGEAERWVRDVKTVVDVIASTQTRAGEVLEYRPDVLRDLGSLAATDPDAPIPRDLERLVFNLLTEIELELGRIADAAETYGGEVMTDGKREITTWPPPVVEERVKHAREAETASEGLLEEYKKFLDLVAMGRLGAVDIKKAAELLGYDEVRIEELSQRTPDAVAPTQTEVAPQMSAEEFVESQRK